MKKQVDTHTYKRNKQENMQTSYTANNNHNPLKKGFNP